MYERLDELWVAMRRATIQNEDVENYRLSMEETVLGLSPWAIWLLVGLVRHRERQLWVADIVRTKLQGSPENLASAGSFGHPEGVRQEGVVPGVAEWEYRFHGIGCCLTHRMTGESIDVDFYDGDGEYFDEWFYYTYLRSLADPDAPERRLIELHPSIKTIRFAIEELRDENAIEMLEGYKVFKLSEEVVDYADLIDAFCQRWTNPNGRFHAATEIGDWLAGCDNLPDQADAATAALVRARAVSCRRRRTQGLLRRLGEAKPDHEILGALAEIGAPELDDVIEQVLTGIPNGFMYRALDLILLQNDARWCERVFHLFERLDPNADMPEPAARMSCATFLLKQNHRPSEVLMGVCKATRYEVAEAALLVLEYDAVRSLPLFQTALRSPAPIHRMKAAAILAILDEEWGRRELIQVLRESQDQEMTCDCRAALCCSSSPEARHAAEEWEQRFPYVPESGPFYSSTDQVLYNCDSNLQYMMTTLHDRVLPLRGRMN